MKCDIDINLGSSNAKVESKYGNQVSIVQVMDCTS